MARYFAFNTLAGCKRSGSAILDGQTTSGHFNSTYVSSFITVPNSGAFFEVGAPFADGSTSATTLWFRTDIRFTNAGGNAPFVTFLNSGANAYRVIVSGTGTLQMQAWISSAWTNVGSTFSYAVDTLYTLVVRIVCGSTMEAYMGGTQVASGSATGAPSAITAIRGTSQSASTAVSWSQIMGADYDLRDANYMHQPPSANGTYTQGTGTAADVAETVLDDGTVLSLATSGHKRTFTKSAVTVPTGKTIGAAVLNMRGRIGGTITDAKGLVRSSTTDNSTTGRTFNTGLEPRYAMWENDPATTAPFTQSGFNSAEFGVEAV